MTYNGFDCSCGGAGLIPDPNRKWWQFWKTIPCPHCDGSGHRNTRNRTRIKIR